MQLIYKRYILVNESIDQIVTLTLMYKLPLNMNLTQLGYQ